MSGRGVKTFELLLHIREAVGQKSFADALALLSAPPHLPPDPERLVRVEQGGRALKLPWNFMCDKGHTHPVTDVAALLDESAPKCLLRRVLSELLL